MKKFMIMAIMVGLCACLWAETPKDVAQKISQAGDAKWDALVAQYQKDKVWVDLAKTDTIVAKFKNYQDKVMLFPKIDFSDFVTDRDGNKYYWYGEKEGYNFYVIKYDPKIQDQLLKLNNALGIKGEDYEVLGKLVDTWSWWGNVVQMEVVAMRLKGVACVTIENGAPVLAGDKILSDFLASKASNWTEGIKTDATSVPAGLEPEMVAKWFLYYGSTKKNQDMWVKLCSIEERLVDKQGDLQAAGRSYWGMISKPEREYYFVRANPDRGDANKKYFMYMMKIDGKDVGSAKPMTVVKEKSGEWRVASF